MGQCRAHTEKIFIDRFCIVINWLERFINTYSGAVDWMAPPVQKVEVEPVHMVLRSGYRQIENNFLYVATIVCRDSAAKDASGSQEELISTMGNLSTWRFGVNGRYPAIFTTGLDCLNAGSDPAALISYGIDQDLLQAHAGYRWRQRRNLENRAL